MRDKRVAENPRHCHRHGISDLSRCRPKTPDEFKVHRKGLKTSRLPDADRPMLTWMTEPAV